MDEESVNNVIMQQPMTLANRFIWVIKDFTEYHSSLSLVSPEFVLNTTNEIEEKFTFEIAEMVNENNDNNDEADDSDDSEDEYKLVFRLDSEVEAVRKLDIIYSILDKTGKIIHDEERVTVTLEPKSKVRQRLSLIDNYDMKDLIFRNGVIVLHICIIDVTIDKSVIYNLVRDIGEGKDMRPVIRKEFVNFYETKDLCDFVMKVEDKEFHVHKFALAANSPVFAALFVNEAKHARDNDMTITDASPQVVKEMLRYMYTGNVNNIQDLAGDLLKIAHKYSLDGLVKMCASHLKKRINVSNVMSMLAFAIKYNVEELKNATHMFFIANTSKILEGGEFLDFINSYAFSFDSLL